MMPDIQAMIEQVDRGEVVDTERAALLQALELARAGEAFKDEMDIIKNDAAKRLNCHPEELKCRFDSFGQVEVERMTLMEMKEFEKQGMIQKKKQAIMKAKGMI